jgi:indolepyruvate decarboxylase
MSFSVPGAVGAKFAKPDKRPIVIVGDGAFQMTGSEFCSHVRYGVNSIIIILNNRGYSTERAIMEGKFNDVHNWQYEKITDLMNGGRGFWSGTVEGFDWMFKKALGDEDDSYVLNVQIDPSDQSDVMKSIAHKMCQKSL